MTDIIATLEADAAKVEADFASGLKWLGTEFASMEKWLEGVDPNVAAAVQKLVSDGEAAAAELAQYGGDALTSLITGAAPELETTIANFVSGLLGGSPTAVAATAAGQSIIGDASVILQNLVKVNLVKVIAAVAPVVAAAV